MLTPEQKHIKDERLSGAIQHGIAEFVERESNGKSLITITRVALSADKKRATVFFTTFPDSYEEQVLLFLKRNMSDLVYFLKKKFKFSRLPLLEVMLDIGEKNRQKIDTIITKENNNEELSEES